MACNLTSITGSVVKHVSLQKDTPFGSGLIVIRICTNVATERTYNLTLIIRIIGLYFREKTHFYTAPLHLVYIRMISFILIIQFIFHTL